MKPAICHTHWEHPPTGARRGISPHPAAAREVPLHAMRLWAAWQGVDPICRTSLHPARMASRTRSDFDLPDVVSMTECRAAHPTPARPGRADLGEIKASPDSRPLDRRG